MTLSQLEYLTPAELIILSQHLKLGTTHLEQHLSEEELESLLKSLSLKHSQISKIDESEAEISGNLTLVLNTIFTSVFGAWMGYSGFLGVSLNSIWVFGSIIAIAAFVGALIGYQNIQFTKHEAQSAVRAQTLHQIQLKILDKIEGKRREEMIAIGQELNELFMSLSEGTDYEEKMFILDLTGKSQEEISEWASKVEKMGKEKLKTRFSSLVRKECTEEWMEIQNELKQNLISFFEDKDELDIIRSDSPEVIEEALDSSWKKLVFTSPKESAHPPSWIRSNLRSLLVGLAPTLLGGFSSLSVYWGGVPLILQNFGLERAFRFFTNPKVVTVELVISLILTAYFGFAFVFANLRVFKRHHELEKTHKKIVQKETSLTILDADMVKLKELRTSALQLMKFFKIVDKISGALKQ